MSQLKARELIATENADDADLITHGGVFHSDEVFSTAVLINVINKEKVKICRIDDKISINENAIVYDIGGGKYDHHQLGGNGERENGVQYSSFGLIWKEFGKEFIQNLEMKNVADIWEFVDKRLVQTIDAVDNGQLKKITQFDFEILTVPNIVSLYNSNWEENENQDLNFIQAVKFAEELLIRLAESCNSKLKARDEIESIIENSNNQILILDKFMPWKDFLLQSENPKAKEILYAIFPSNRGGYSVCTVPKELGNFESRKLFPEEWAGLCDEELQKITNVKTAVFCHNGRFICSAKTKEDAILLAQLAKNK